MQIKNDKKNRGIVLGLGMNKIWKIDILNKSSKDDKRKDIANEVIYELSTESE